MDNEKLNQSGCADSTAYEAIKTYGGRNEKS